MSPLVVSSLVVSLLLVSLLDVFLSSCCSAPPPTDTFGHAIVVQAVYGGTPAELIVGRVVALQCNAGFFQAGSQATTCLTTGVWSSAVSNCQGESSSTRASKRKITVKFSGILSPKTLTYSVFDRDFGFDSHE